MSHVKNNKMKPEKHKISNYLNFTCEETTTKKDEHIICL